MQFHLDGFKPGDPHIAVASAQTARHTETVPALVDVLIIGCGPAGLTLAAQLAVFPDIRTCIVEQKDGPLQLGQADGIACRTMEMFEAFNFSERADIKIAIINRSSVVSDADVLPAVNALQTQVSRDFAPAWGINADLTFVPTSDSAPADAWWLVIADDSDQADALGYHETTEQGKPLGKVFAKTALQDRVNWTITASHELLEMLADPEINLTVFVQDTDTSGTLYAYEVCDACEADQFGHQIGELWVSDFVYPAWFENSRAPGSTQFDQTNQLSEPLPKLLSGGYIGAFRVSQGGGWQQVTSMHRAAGMRNVVASHGSRRQRRSMGKNQWRRSTLLEHAQSGQPGAIGTSRPTRASLKVHQARIDAVTAERQARIAAHKQAVRTRRTASTATAPLNLFAAGDSWFDYPLPVFGSVDVMTALADGGHPTPLVLKLAHHGDEARTTLGLEKRQRIIDALSDSDNGTFDAILFSGGGNDIVGDQFCLWVKDWQAGMSPNDGVDMARLRHALGVVEAAYLELIALRNQHAVHAKICMHAYDFAIPDGLRCAAASDPGSNPHLIIGVGRTQMRQRLSSKLRCLNLMRY